MTTALYTVGLTIGAIQISQNVVRTSTKQNSQQVTLPVGKSGSLTTRTDDNTGTFAATAHGLVVGNLVDVYWAGAGNVRYGMSVTVVPDANSVTLDGGAGDVLPSAATAVVITKVVAITANIEADAIQIIGVEANMATAGNATYGHIICLDPAGVTLVELDLVSNVPRIYDVVGGSTNPFAPVVAATFTAAGTDIITSTGHGLLDGQQLRVSNSGGALPAGLVANTWYFVDVIDANTFKVSLTQGGAAVDITDAGTGTHTWTRRNQLTTIRATNGSATEAMTLKIPCLESST